MSITSCPSKAPSGHLEQDDFGIHSSSRIQKSEMSMTFFCSGLDLDFEMLSGVLLLEGISEFGRLEGDRPELANRSLFLSFRVGSGFSSDD